MTWSRFRAAEVKASYAFVLSVISWIPCAAATMLAYRNYDPTLGQIIYGSTGRFVPVFVGCVLLSMARRVAGIGDPNPLDSRPGEGFFARVASWLARTHDSPTVRTNT